jgi:hypothetical protein
MRVGDMATLVDTLRVMAWEPGRFLLLNPSKLQALEKMRVTSNNRT